MSMVLPAGIEPAKFLIESQVTLANLSMGAYWSIYRESNPAL